MSSSKKVSKKSQKAKAIKRIKPDKSTSIKTFSLDHLTDTQFEQFCFDLLGELRFVNVKWRKGTGLPTSPSDRGRDIECQLECTDIDGHKYFEKWYVECKHSVKGVSPDKIQGALTWAKSERPDRLLIIASTFLSNPTHDFIEDYINNERPYYKIKVWQKPDLEKLIIGKSTLLRKYNIISEFPFLSIIHPAHLLYIKNMRFNSFDYFLSALDKLETKEREKILSWVNEIIIRPRYKKAATGNETRADLRIDEISYNAFKEKGRMLANLLGGPFLVCSIVSWLLKCLFDFGDTTAIDEKTEKLNSSIKFIEGVKKAYEGDPEGDALGLECYLQQIDEQKKDAPYLSNYDVLEDIEIPMSIMRESISKVHATTHEGYSLYEHFCEVVVRDLLIEEIF